MAGEWHRAAVIAAFVVLVTSSALPPDDTLELRKPDPFVESPGILQFGNIINAMAENNMYLSASTSAADHSPDTPEFELLPYKGGGGPGFVQCEKYETSVRLKADTLEDCHTHCAERKACELVTYYSADAVTSKKKVGNDAGDHIVVKDHNDWPRTCYLIQECGEQIQVRDTDGLRANTYKKVRSQLPQELDWALVKPEDASDHRPIQSGDLVALRSPGSGKFVSYDAFEENVRFGHTEQPSRAAQFRLLTAEDAKNDVESTARVSISPKYGSIKPGELVLLLPQSDATDPKRVDKYSVYGKGKAGLLQLTDSTFIGWQFTLAEHNTCVAPTEAEGLACCEWIKVDDTNNGVAESEQRRCCDRTLLSNCAASVKRVKACAGTHSPDETLAQVQQARESWHQAELIAAPLQARQMEAQAAFETGLTQLKELMLVKSDHSEQEKQWSQQLLSTQALLKRQPHRKEELELKIKHQTTQASHHHTEGINAATALEAAKSAKEAAEAGLREAESLAAEAAAKAEALKVAYEVDQSGGECCGLVTLSEAGANPSVVKWECCGPDGCRYLEHRTRVTHKECNWNGKLGQDGCSCDANHGGLDCSVEIASGTCFSGTRNNGQRPSDRAACATCYKCQSGAAKRTAGVVTVAGDDQCLLLHGKENMCLSCHPGAALIRVGDSDLPIWNQGYRQRGYCRPFPKVSISMADSQTAHPLSCESQCGPSHNHLFSQSKLMWCSKVCSAWNSLHVARTASHRVATVALCEAVKQTHCHTDATTTLSNMDTAPHKCFSQKEVQPWAVCYSKAQAGPHSYNDGWGTTCAQDGGLNANSGQSSSWLAQRVSDLNTGLGARWCCFGKTGQLPKWMREQEKPDSYWCSGVAMRL
eukprot:TRINITY_DN5772_c0_g1_i1.p1 TRINITY_DN5772_c0_g1~~TRINITY_DN5772_c0_g1_i1.p1  ORF type:complete len:875 (-),score=214.22 TRINITY_DN5772_c0_g1_i1:272-2896(-)